MNRSERSSDRHSSGNDTPGIRVVVARQLPAIALIVTLCFSLGDPGPAWAAARKCPFNGEMVPGYSLPGGPDDLGFSWRGPIRPAGDPCVETVAISPGSPEVWYVSALSGFFVSSDRGRRWKRIGAIRYPGEAAVNPDSPLEVYVSSANLLFRSQNQGKKWKRVATFSRFIRSVEVGPGGVVYVSHHDDDHALASGLSISRDHGRTWRFSPFGGNWTGLIGWDIALDEDGTLYVGAEIFDHPRPYRPPLFRSRDGGATWENIAGNIPWHVISLATRSGEVLALTEGAGLFVSSDGGDSWASLSAPPGVPSLVLRIDPDDPQRLFGGGLALPPAYPGGVLMSTDGGRTFERSLTGGIVGSMAIQSEICVTAYLSGVYCSPLP